MSNNNGGLILVVLIALVIFGNGPATPTPGPGPSPSPVSEAMQKHVSGVRSVVASAQPGPRSLLSKGFSELADVLSVNPGVITTTDTLAKVLRDESVFLMKAASLQGTVPGWDKAVNDSLDSAFGADTTAVDQAKAVEFIRALAWAAGG